jgi:DNA replication protein DnaC
MANISRSIAEKEKAEKQMQVNGKEFEEFIASSMGIHYLKNFEDGKIREKEKLDKKIDEMFNTGKGIILFGDVGVGKTMDLVYISKRIIEKQNRPQTRCIDPLNDEEIIIYEELPIPVSYHFMPSLFDKLHFGEKVNLKKFVLLDDWGREYAETFALSRFEILVEEIYANENSLVITTNLTKEQFINRDGWARATDRVREICSILEIPGKSMRHK